MMTVLSMVSEMKKIYKIKTIVIRHLGFECTEDFVQYGWNILLSRLLSIGTMLVPFIRGHIVVHICARKPDQKN